MSSWDNFPDFSNPPLPKALIPPRTPFGPRRQRVPISVAQYGSQQAFEESVGQAVKQPPTPTKVITVSDSAGYLIQPLNQKVAIRYGVSVEMLVRERRALSAFIGHPDDVSFDSMDLSVTGRTGLPLRANDPAGWIATAQLIQRIGDNDIAISGKIKERDGDFSRLVTQVSAYSDDIVTEFDSGYLEKPWAMFLNVGITRILGNEDLPDALADLRIQVTVNLVSQAT